MAELTPEHYAVNQRWRLREAEVNWKALISEYLETIAHRCDESGTCIIGRIKADGKCTPAMEISVFPAMSTAALEHFEKSAPRVIGKTGIREPARGSNPDVLPTWNGKTWEQMKPLERYQLGRENLDLFNAMRECAR